ncbi:MAG: folylpolyglutamate synthase/dihydrofolate synthase family protein [Chthoniobacterales bacterium]
MTPNEERPTAPAVPMPYREALAWLFGTQLFGIKLGLENIERLLDALRIPRESAASRKIIHVAGTNGKGSVCAMIDSICRAQGYRTGLFTSPHLITFRERIRVDGEMISEADVTRGLTTIRETVHAWEPHPTFFEIATALGLLHFREQKCEIVVLETGMGGRLDATNSITPVVSVITPIALDHQKWLGHSLAEIAAEKAGIIKPGVPVVSAAQLAEAGEVIRARFGSLKEGRSPRRRVATGAARRVPLLEFIPDVYTTSQIALPGAHQTQNAALALAALRVAGIEVSARAIADGLATVQWPARFQRFDDRIVIDGAHNPSGARILVETWREVFGNEKATLIFGALADKDIAASWRELREIAAAVILPHFRGERVAPPAEVARIVESITLEIPRTLTESTSAAIETARQRPGKTLICGSLHLAGEALAHLLGTPAVFEECAQ